MQELHAGLQAGTRVVARGEQWSILGLARHPPVTIVSLEGGGPGNTGRRLTLIAPFDRLAPEPDAAPVYRRRATACRRALAALGSSRPARGVWSAATGRFELLPWQLAPVRAALTGTPRMLLADGVGLGKTLQAGLVVAELSARGLAARTLVLAPSGLRDLWVSQLSAHLQLDAVAMDAAAIAERREGRAAGANPWLDAAVAVASIDFVKQAEVRAALAGVPLDVLVVDEAHHLSPGTDRHALVAALAARTPWVILVSATPHDGDPRSLDALLDIGSTGGPGDPAMRVFRRSRRDTGIPGSRRLHTLRVRPTALERALADGLRAYAQRLSAVEAGARPGLRLLGSVLARRGTSSAFAAERSIARRIAALSGATAEPAAGQAQLPWDDTDEGDAIDAVWCGLPALADAAQEREELRRLAIVARDAREASSKFHRLERLLDRIGEPAVVFSEFRDTIVACAEALGTRHAAAVLHGGLSLAERTRALDTFLDGRARVLLATDVAGEGLNLQARARLIVTLDWPWSFRRLEQRIGRVDRIGQARTVHAVHLTARDTFEETVVARLLMRAARSHGALEAFEAPPPDAEVEAAVLDTTCDIGRLPTPRPGSHGPDLDAAGHADVERASRARHLSACTDHRDGRPCWTLPCGKVASAVAIVVDVTASAHGQLVWSEAVGVRVTLTRRPRSRRQWRALCLALMSSPAVLGAAARAARDRNPHARWTELLTRLAQLRRRVDDTPGPALQPSLFDRRAEREAEDTARHRASVAGRLAWLEHRLDGDALAPRVHARAIVALPMDEAGS
ncbi:MAG: helicase-related protein [Vicinamibacterales bacterium]